LENIRGELTKSATAAPQRFLVKFPKGTVLVHQNLGTRISIASFSVLYQLITAGDLSTTKGLGVNPYLDDSIYKLQNEITNEDVMIDSSKLKLGFNTILEPGKYYHNPKLGFSYYCLEVRDSDADLVLVESYQMGQLFQATLHGSPKEWWWQYIEVTEKKAIDRLTKLYEEYMRL
jgi:hypothetical protein